MGKIQPETPIYFMGIKPMGVSGFSIFPNKTNPLPSGNLT
jgi:hypothetical protein